MVGFVGIFGGVCAHETVFFFLSIRAFSCFRVNVASVPEQTARPRMASLCLGNGIKHLGNERRNPGC